MPPPHWRSSGAVFHVRAALKTTARLLRRLVPVYAETTAAPGSRITPAAAAVVTAAAEAEGISAARDAVLAVAAEAKGTLCVG